jgi:chitodextrinase
MTAEQAHRNTSRTLTPTLRTFRHAVVMSAMLAGAPQLALAQSTTAFVQAASAVPQSSPTSVTVTYTQAQAPGDFNVVVVGWNSATGQVQAVTDTKGNTYVLAVGPTVSPGFATQSIYYAANIAGAAAGANTVTVTFTAAALFPDIRVAEYRGIASTTPVDGAVAAIGSSATSSSGALVTTNASDLLVAANIVQTGTSGAGTGFTNRSITAPDGDILEDQIVSATGSYTATAPLSSAGGWIMQLVAFKAATVGPDTTPPTAPGTPVLSVVSSTQINLTWAAATDNVGVTGYLVERCAGVNCSTFSQIATPTTISFTDTGLTASTSYTYRVRATDAANNLGPYSGISTASTQTPPDTQPPTAPGMPVLTVVSSAQINLTWAGATDNVGVTGYFVERCAGAGCATFAQVGAPTTTSFIDTGLSASTTYTYRVRATDAAGNLGAYSGTASGETFPPAAITLVQHTSIDAGSTPSSSLAFTENTGTGNWIAVVVRAGNTGQAFTVTDSQGNTYRQAVQLNETTDGTTVAIYYAENITGGTTTVTVSDSLGGTLRFAILEYAGIAISNSLDGTAIGQGTSTTPTTASATLSTAGDLVIGALSTADAETFAVGSDWTIEENVPAEPNTKLAVEDQIMSTAGSVSATGILSSSDPWGAVVASFHAVSAGVDTQAPTAPGTPILSVVSSTQINLTWAAATDNVGVTAYFVERCTGIGCSTFAAVGSPSTTSFSDTGLAASTSYTYRVRATDAAGNLGPYSTVASATTQNTPDTQPPTAPGTPILNVVSSTQINLTWAPATDNVGVTGYLVERCTGVGCSTFAAIGSPAAASFSDTGLAASTSYAYRVRATDAAGNLGPYSTVASATTQNASDTQPPTAPGTPILSVVSSTQINLTWDPATDNVGVTSYSVERCTGAGCTTFAPVGSPATTSFTDIGLTASTSYSYRVRATDAAGNLGAYSGTATAATFASPTITLVQHNSIDAGTTKLSSLAFGANTIAGNWIAVVIRAGRTGQTFTVTDTAGNTYQKAVQLNETTDNTTLAIYYAENINGGATTVSVGNSINGGTLRFAIFEYSGVALANSLDATATGQGTSATPATAVATAASSGDLVIGGLSSANPQTFTAGSGWTLEESVPATPNTKLAVEDQIMSTAGSISATATLSSSDAWGAVVAAFRVAASSADLTLAKTHSGNFAQSQTGATYTLTVSNVGNGTSTGTVTVSDTLPAALTATALGGSGWSCTVSPLVCARSDALVSGGSYPDITLTVDVSAAAPASVTNSATVVGGGDLNPSNNTATDITTIVAIMDTVPPSAPGTLTGTAISGGEIDLTWGAATDNVGVAGYRVERCLGADCTSFVKLATTSSTTLSDTGLTPNTTYSYIVRAFDAANNLGPYSNSVSVTTLANDPTLVAAFGFDEGSGTSTVDASANQFSGTLSNATWTTGGRYGNALVFNGAARVVIPDASAFHLTSAMTLEAWVNPSATPTDWVDVVCKGNDNYYLEAGTPQGTPAAGANAGSLHVNALGSVSLPLNVWSHLAATYDGTALRLYVNGTQVSSQPLAGVLATSTDPLEIGGDSLYGQFFRGTIDEVRIYNVALTPTQIQTDMATPVNQSIVQILLNPTNIDFGTQATGTTSDAQQVTLTNSGSTPLIVTNISLTGPNASEFAFSTTCGSSVDPGSSCALNATFTPTATGTKSASIVIASNASGLQTVALIGAGTGFSLSPGTIALTSSLTQQFSVTGGGAAPLVWSVDGVQGGTATTGTITATGLYSPPPTSGVHVVTVTTSDLSNTSSATVYVTNYPGTFTHHNDASRSGQNLSESVLTPSNVTPASFGKLFSYALDGVAMASPLYVANVRLSDASVHNVVYVATEHDSVYAFDADGRSANPLWQTSFISPAVGPGVTAVPSNDTGECCDIAPEIGITGTPVIDPASGTLYVVAKTKEISGTTVTYVQRLHALDITTGTEKFGGPVVLNASVPGQGQGTDGVNVPFDALHENQRPALLLNNGVVYIGFAAHGDVQPYHGWVLGYNATTLRQTMAFNVSPNGDGGGIWQANGGLAADAAGNIYFVTGNGAFDADVGGTSYGDSFVKIDPTGTVVDYFTPSDQASISATNFDLGAAGPLLLPDQPGAHTHLIVSAGKDNTVYLVDRDKMGGFNSNDNSQIVQSLVDIFPYGTPEPGNYSSPVYFNGTVYFGPIADNIQAFRLTNGLLSTSATTRSSDIYAYPGATMTISANGSANGILWAVQRNGDCGTQSSCGTASPGVLKAYDASNLTFLLYSSDQAIGDRDALDFAVKFSVPIVANGKVFVGTTGRLTVYGLLP